MTRRRCVPVGRIGSSFEQIRLYGPAQAFQSVERKLIEMCYLMGLHIHILESQRTPLACWVLSCYGSSKVLCKGSIVHCAIWLRSTGPTECSFLHTIPYSPPWTFCPLLLDEQSQYWALTPLISSISDHLVSLFFTQKGIIRRLTWALPLYSESVISIFGHYDLLIPPRSSDMMGFGFEGRRVSPRFF